MIRRATEGTRGIAAGMVLLLAFILTGAELSAVGDKAPVQHPGRRTEICPGATYFYNHRSMRRPPDWARDMRVVCRIGEHTFLAPRARHHDRGQVAAKD